MENPQLQRSDEQHIRQMLEGNAEAVRVKDIDNTVASYSPDVLLFDLIEPLQTRSTEALRNRLAQWFASFDGPIGFELRNLSISANTKLAFSSSINHLSATKLDGTELDMQWRATLCLENIDGNWMITHSHASVPFNMETGQASVDLEV